MNPALFQNRETSSATRAFYLSFLATSACSTLPSFLQKIPVITCARASSGDDQLLPSQLHFTTFFSSQPNINLLVGILASVLQSHFIAAIFHREQLHFLLQLASYVFSATSS